MGNPLGLKGLKQLHLSYLPNVLSLQNLYRGMSLNHIHCKVIHYQHAMIQNDTDEHQAMK